MSRFSGNLIYLFKALCIAFILEGTLFLTISETYRAASSIVMKTPVGCQKRPGSKVPEIHAGRIIGRTDTICGLTVTVIHLDGRKCPFNVFSESGLLAPCRIMIDREHVAVQPITGYLPSAVERRPVPVKPFNQIPQPPLPKPFFMMVVFLLAIYFNTLCSDLTSFGSPTHLYSTSHQLGTAYLLSFLTI